MIFGQDFEKFNLGHKRPAIGPGPAKLRVRGHPLDPAVHKDALVLIKHALCKAQYLLARLVEIRSLAS